jgi:hypothetical protein
MARRADSGLDRETLREIGGAPSEVGVYQGAAPQQPMAMRMERKTIARRPEDSWVGEPAPIPAQGRDYADWAAEYRPVAYANSLTGQLSGINAMRSQAVPPANALTLDQFRMLMSGLGTAPNMHGYEQLRQTLGGGGLPQMQGVPSGVPGFGMESSFAMDRPPRR